jgi:hypothetical protein
VAWVRLDDDALNSLKVMRLSDSAFRLWVKGLCYCQRQLTDGFIPAEWLKEVGAKRKDIDMLSTSNVDGKAPLWEPQSGSYQVHDYLDWNDSRATVTKKRNDAKERMAHARERSSREVTAHVRTNFPRTSQEVLRGVVKSTNASSLQDSSDKQDPERESEGKLKSSKSGDAAFDAFWAAFPRKRAEKDARRAWDKIRPDAALRAVILAALQQQSQSFDWRKEGGRFIPYPATWLNRGQWTDSAETVSLLSDTAAYNLAAMEEAGRLIDAAEAKRRANGTD